MAFFGSHSSGIKKPKFQQWFFLADKAVVSKNRNFGNGFFDRIAVVSKNRNYCNGFFFWQTQQWYQTTEILAMVFWQTQQWYQKTETLAMVFFGRHSSGIKKPKLLQWFFLADIAVVSKNRNFGNGFFFWQTQQWFQNIEILAFFFFFADIAVVSKNRNYGNGFFYLYFTGYH